MMKVRVSIGNLVVSVKSLSSGYSLLGILSAGAYKKGVIRFQPIGGAAEMTETGQKFLEQNFDAENFHTSQEGKIDARFVIDDSRLGDVFAFFEARNGKFFEIDPLREIVDELSKIEFPASGNLPELPPVLTREEAESISVKYLRTVAQPFKNEPGTSTLEMKDVPSRRLFHQFTMHVSSDMLRKLGESKAIRFLTEREVRSTEGGAHKGATADGIELADNFII